MKLQQLRVLAAVAQNDLNLTAAASRLSTTQSAVSKQLKALEDELGFRIFVRRGRAFTSLTPPGQCVVDSALRALHEAQNIQNFSDDMRQQNRGALSIGTTHTQARYVLPPIIKQFCTRYPEVEFHLHQGTAEQIAEMGRRRQIDFAIATGARDLFDAYAVLPWYRWRERVIVPRMHPLATIGEPRLEELADYPLVTYVFSPTAPSALIEAFTRSGLSPRIALTARDADVIKTYVRLGLGIGVVPGLTIDARADQDLVALDAGHLPSGHTTWIGFRRDVLLRRYMYEFLQSLAPHLTRVLVERAAGAITAEDVENLLAHEPVPVR